GQGFTAQRAEAINNSNEIVGTAYNLNNGDFQGFRSNNGANPTALNFLAPGAGFGAGTLGAAHAINSSGQAAGEAGRDAGAALNPTFAARYPSGSATPTDLPLASGFNSAYGFRINDAGHVVGFADNDNSSAAPPNGTNGPSRGYSFNGTTAVALG